MENSVADPTTWLDVLGAVSTVLAALVAVGGVILTLIVTNRREGQRQEREIEERRWSTLRNERRQVYSEFVLRWARYLEAKTSAPQASLTLQELSEERFRRLLEVEAAYRDLQRVFNALSLIAPTEVRAAADGVLKWSDLNEEERDPAVPGRFWKAARKDLRIPD